MDDTVLSRVLSLVLNHRVFVTRTATTIPEVAITLREWEPELAIVDMAIAESQAGQCTLLM